MDNKQKANAYAIAKTLGYENSVEDFFKEYSQCYDEAYKKLQSELPENKAYAVKFPNPNSGNF